jgi:hypothetical protein
LWDSVPLVEHRARSNAASRRRTPKKCEVPAASPCAGATVSFSRSAAGEAVGVLCQKWIGGNERDIGRFPSASMARRWVETVGFGTPMTAPKKGLTLPLPLQFLAARLAVWLGRVLQEQVDFLRAENRLLREKLGTKRIRLTDAERRRLPTLGKKLGRKGLAAVATIASPETILRWYRELVAKKYDGSERRGPGRPKKRGEIAELMVRMEAIMYSRGFSAALSAINVPTWRQRNRSLPAENRRAQRDR